MNKVACLAILALFCRPSFAAPVLYAEISQGDLSGDGNAPTAFGFALGENRVSGTMGREGAGPVDKDIFSFVVPEGTWVTSLVLTLDPAENSFLALAAGPTIRTDVTHPTDAGQSHLSNMLTRQTGEILPALAAFKEFGGTTSTATNPLGPGTYSMWIQEVSTRVDYEFAFTVVPEPGTLALLAVAGVAMAALNRRGRSGRSPRA